MVLLLFNSTATSSSASSSSASSDVVATGTIIRPGTVNSSASSGLTVFSTQTLGGIVGVSGSATLSVVGSAQQHGSALVQSLTSFGLIITVVPASITTSALPARHTLIIWRGATFRQKVALKLDAKTVRDLTGYTAMMEIRAHPAGPVVLTLDIGNGGASISGPEGTVDLYMPEATTQTLASGIYQLSISGQGLVEPLLWGPLQVRGL